jgi:hypothetical protein
MRRGMGVFEKLLYMLLNCYFLSYINFFFFFFFFCLLRMHKFQKLYLYIPFSESIRATSAATYSLEKKRIFKDIQGYSMFW